MGIFLLLLPTHGPEITIGGKAGMDAALIAAVDPSLIGLLKPATPLHRIGCKPSKFVLEGSIIAVIGLVSFQREAVLVTKRGCENERVNTVPICSLQRLVFQEVYNVEFATASAG